MSSVRALAPRTTMVAGHYLFLLVPFFFLLFVLPLSIESSAVFRAGATFSPSPFRVESLGTAVGSSSGGRRHGGGGEHYPDRSAGGICYDSIAFSKENILVGGGT
jgi:hypothetical protein